MDQNSIRIASLTPQLGPILQLGNWGFANLRPRRPARAGLGMQAWGFAKVRAR